MEDEIHFSPSGHWHGTLVHLTGGSTVRVNGLPAAVAAVLELNSQIEMAEIRKARMVRVRTEEIND